MHMGSGDNDWVNLDDYLVSLFRQNLTDSREFKTLLRIYKRERILRAWKAFKAGQYDINGTASDDDQKKDLCATRTEA
jgi:hypothetical protein